MCLCTVCFFCVCHCAWKHVCLSCALHKLFTYLLIWYKGVASVPSAVSWWIKEWWGQTDDAPGLVSVYTQAFYGTFWDHQGEPVPEENIWALWCKRQTHRPSGWASLHPDYAVPTSTIPHFLQAGCPSCRPANSVKALKATSAFGLGRRR